MDRTVAHRLVERRVDQPVLLDERQPVEARARDDDLEVVAAAGAVDHVELGGVRKRLRQETSEPFGAHRTDGTYPNRVNFGAVSPERGLALQRLSPVDELASLSPPKGTVQMERRRSWFELHREDGQTMTEYGVLLALIAVVVIVALVVLGPKVASLFTYIGSQL